MVRRNSSKIDQACTTKLIKKIGLKYFDTEYYQITKANQLIKTLFEYELGFDSTLGMLDFVNPIILRRISMNVIWDGFSNRLEFPIADIPLIIKNLQKVFDEYKSKPVFLKCESCWNYNETTNTYCVNCGKRFFKTKI